MRDLILDVENMDHFGRGIAHKDGLLYFIDGALPGERVKANIITEKKKYFECRVVSILNKSNDRIKPCCPYYDKCGGCNIMHLNYQKQLNFKKQKVKEVLKKFCEFENVKDIIPTNQFYYRNKVTFQVKKQIGYYKERSYEIVCIDNCLIADDRINNLIPSLNKIDLDNIKQIVVRVTSNQIMLVFYCDIPLNLNVELFKDVDTVVCISKDKTVLKGKGYIEDIINGIKYCISPTSFFQVNNDGMLKLYNKVLEYADMKGDESLLDLYCGTGTIGIYLSKYCEKVLGIELNEEAINDAFINKKINNINNIDFKVGDVKEVLKRNRFNPDIIIVDPPRNGLDKKVINSLITLKPKKLIYVSCDVVTLARDLKLLSDDFEIIECTPVDMFPNTYHVECCTLLNLKGNRKI